MDRPEAERKTAQLKKIAIIAQGASEGGAERVATLLANYFSEKQYEVYFYAVYSDKREYYLDERIRYQYCSTKAKTGALRMLERSKKVRALIRKHQIDTMISFVYVEGIFLIGSKQTKKIYSLRCDPVNSRDTNLQKKLRDKIYRDADCIVFQTPDERDYFPPAIRNHGVIIPNPVKSGLPYWKIKEHQKEILAAGRLTAQKNFAMLIDGFACFAKTHPDYRLTICGDGELKESLISQARHLGVDDRISFPGFITDIHKRMTEAEIYVSTSDYEGISNSMLEALAIGIPTICTDCPAGGAAMFIRSNENGILIPTKDVAALDKALSALADNPELCQNLSEEAVKIRQILDVEKICRRWEELI